MQSSAFAPLAGAARATAAPVLALVLVLLAHTPAGAATSRGSFDRPPYFHGKLPAVKGVIAHVAVSFRDEPGSLDPTPDSSPALAGLLDSLRVELDRLGLTKPLAGGDWPMKDGPDVRFGARRGGTAKDGTPLGPDEIDPSEPRRMTFDVEGPGRAWKDRVTRSAGDSVGAVLVVQLGFAEHWVRQVNWKGSKAIELGAGRQMPVQWLTSLDDPVQVLELTGAIVEPTGRFLRVGAEGLLARRTGMGASALGAQEVLTEPELEALGAPAWRAALRSLVEGLLDRAGR